MIERLVRLALGLLAMFGGAALLLTILASVPLPLALLVMGTVAIVGVLVVIQLAPHRIRARMRRRALLGMVAGAVAVVVYDLVKGTLGVIDPSPYNPFETLRVFGELILGPTAPTEAMYLVGFGLHVGNGVFFGIGYAFLLANVESRSLRWAVLSGIAWGVFLETFQLLLFPDWLGIQLVTEFTVISFIGHLAYGFTLGVMVRTVARRLDRSGGTSWTQT